MKRATLKLKKPVKKSVKKNPVPRSRHAKVKKAIDLYQRFRGTDPEFVDEYVLPSVDVAMQIGRCDGILYTTIRDGKKESYIHEFTGASCPILAASWDGKQIILIDGKYNFTEEGIKDG